MNAEEIEKVTHSRHGVSFSTGTGSPLRVVLMVSDEKFGSVFAVAGDREWLEVRITPSGLLRISEARSGVPEWIREDAP
jgi:hypothetical protein